MSKQDVVVILDAIINHEQLEDGNPHKFSTELTMNEDDFLETPMGMLRTTVLNSYIRTNDNFWNKKGDVFLGPKEVTLVSLQVRAMDWNSFYPCDGE